MYAAEPKDHVAFSTAAVKELLVTPVVTEGSVPNFEVVRLNQPRYSKTAVFRAGSLVHSKEVNQANHPLPFELDQADHT